MPIVTNFVCDVSGKSSTNRADFIDVNLTAIEYENNPNYSAGFTNRNGGRVEIKRLIHKSVAEKLNLVNPPKGEEKKEPEVTFEGKLKALLRDSLGDLVEEYMENRE